MRYPDILTLSKLSKNNSEITYFSEISERYNTIRTDKDHEAQQRLLDSELLLKVITDYNCEAKKAEYTYRDYKQVQDALQLLKDCRDALSLKGSTRAEFINLQRGTAESIALIAAAALMCMQVIGAKLMTRPGYQITELCNHLRSISRQCLDRYEVVIYND